MLQTETQTFTSPVVEGVVPESTSQATEPTPKEEVQPQETTPAKVDSKEQPTSSLTTERPRPSDHYRQRKELQGLRNQMLEIQKTIEAIKTKETPSVEKPKSQEFDNDKFWGNPLQYMTEREKTIREELSKELLEKGLPEALKNREQKIETERNGQEALELIFPKTDNPRETLKERIQKDKVRAERMEEILYEEDEGFSLDKLSVTYPKQAAKLALQEYAKRYPEPAKNPNAPKKAQMESTSTSQPVGGSKTLSTDEIASQYQQMTKQLGDNPGLLQDEKFKSKWDALKLEIANAQKGNQ